ncbi:MAG: LytTR family transcriptional regulator DNA-binding domain-containing protein [Candidatus Zixiibacteriota bacterium]
MTAIRIVIADDEPMARKYLRSLLSSHTDCEILEECGDADSAVRAILAHDPDLVFLDVQMPGSDGFSVIDRVGADDMPYTVFVTAHDRYAVPAFERNALDYLLKPFSEERFAETLKRVREQLALANDAVWSRKLRSVLASTIAQGNTEIGASAAPALDAIKAPRDRIPVRSAGRIVLIRTDEIEWIEASDCYVTLHRGTEKFLHRESLNTLEAELDANRFIRIHRQSIVNVEFVREIRSHADGESAVLMTNGTILAISRRRKQGLARRLGLRSDG